MPRLKKALRVPAAAPRHPAPIDPDLSSADIRIGLRPRLDARAGTRLPARHAQRTRHPEGQDLQREDQHPRAGLPGFEEALRTAQEVKAHARHCRVIVTVYEMKRLGRDMIEAGAALL
ncbi:hypothetical protein [Streptomyces sp. RLB3-17]|uniref:hypothetical protein n=1 Tax=Streptomyces sp. RLB3-17 TaxID=2594455 RepID=UPI001CED439D|nr:hypothetical protein [Streptomyces sp. RLB3-17]